MLFSRQRAGVDPLGSENILGFVTGPLTGTPGTIWQSVRGGSKVTAHWNLGDAHFWPEISGHI